MHHKLFLGLISLVSCALFIDSTIENTSKNKNVELGFSDEERDQELPDFLSFIPFLPPLVCMCAFHHSDTKMLDCY
jgi:hypothetical protein